MHYPNPIRKEGERHRNQTTDSIALPTGDPEKLTEKFVFVSLIPSRRKCSILFFPSFNLKRGVFCYLKTRIKSKNGLGFTVTNGGQRRVIQRMNKKLSKITGSVVAWKAMAAAGIRARASVHGKLRKVHGRLRKVLGELRKGHGTGLRMERPPASLDDLQPCVQMGNPRLRVLGDLVRARLAGRHKGRLASGGVELPDAPGDGDMRGGKRPPGV